MNLSNIVNSVSTNIYVHGHSPAEFIFEIMQYFYNEGYNPSYLICNPKDLRVIKYIFRDWEAEGKNSYNTDFGLLTLISMKKKTIGYITVTDKDYI